MGAHCTLRWRSCAAIPLGIGEIHCPPSQLRTFTWAASLILPPPFTLTRLKHRATTLIQRYAGSHFREAQRTAWMIDVVTHIDKCVGMEAGQSAVG